MWFAHTQHGVPLLQMKRGEFDSSATAHRFRGTVWRYPGKGGWHFVTLPVRLASTIRAVYGGRARPYGSLAVSVTIGATTWKTSIFPDKKSSSYVLAIKENVREEENIGEGDRIFIRLTVI